MKLQHPLLLVPISHKVDVTLLADADLLAHGSDTRWLSPRERPETEVVQSTISQSISIVAGVGNSGNKVTLG